MRIDIAAKEGCAMTHHFYYVISIADKHPVLEVGRERRIGRAYGGRRREIQDSLS